MEKAAMAVRRATVLRFLTVSLVMLLMALAVPGCRKKSTAPEPAEAPGPNPLTPVAGQPAQSDVRRGAEIQVNRNDLRQIALSYANYEIENNRPPAKLEDFVAYLRSDRNFPAKMIEPLEKGYIVLVPNVKPTSNQVVAYEKHVFERHNNRLVAYGDGRVEMMNDNDFQKIHPTKDQ
jgi:hypothetical protein